MTQLAVWMVTLASVAGTWLVTRKRRAGFAIWIVTNAAWVVYDCAIGAWPQAALFAVYLALAVYGWAHWKESPA